MFVPTKALATNDHRFVYAQSKRGVWIPFMQYDIAKQSLPSRIDLSEWENAQLDGKIELLNYLRNH